MKTSEYLGIAVGAGSFMTTLITVTPVQRPKQQQKQQHTRRNESLCGLAVRRKAGNQRTSVRSRLALALLSLSKVVVC